MFGVQANDKLLTVVRATAGLQSGYRTAEEVQRLFNVNPAHYPTLFRVTKTGLVVKLLNHEAIFQAHIANVRSNWHALGVNA